MVASRPKRDLAAARTWTRDKEAVSLQPSQSSLSGAAPESNRASVGLPRLTGFEDRACLAQPSDLASVRAPARASEAVELASLHP